MIWLHFLFICKCFLDVVVSLLISCSCKGFVFLTWWWVKLSPNICPKVRTWDCMSFKTILEKCHSIEVQNSSTCFLLFQFSKHKIIWKQNNSKLLQEIQYGGLCLFHHTSSVVSRDIYSRAMDPAITLKCKAFTFPHKLSLQTIKKKPFSVFSLIKTSSIKAEHRFKEGPRHTLPWHHRARCAWGMLHCHCFWAGETCNAVNVW